MSGGKEFLQSKTRKENLALRAKACAKVLPCRHVWEKEKYCKELTENIMSLIKWPTDGWWKRWFLIAKVDASESPSKIELCKSSSWIKVTALLVAMISTATMDNGRGMISGRATSTSPEKFRTTTPIPTAPNSSKTESSKFVFKVLRSVGFQMASFGGCLMTGLTWRC